MHFCSAEIDFNIQIKLNREDSLINLEIFIKRISFVTFYRNHVLFNLVSAWNALKDYFISFITKLISDELWSLPVYVYCAYKVTWKTVWFKSAIAFLLCHCRFRSFSSKGRPFSFINSIFYYKIPPFSGNAIVKVARKRRDNERRHGKKIG